jgi:hypothetical protein
MRADRLHASTLGGGRLKVEPVRGNSHFTQELLGTFEGLKVCQSEAKLALLIGSPPPAGVFIGGEKAIASDESAQVPAAIVGSFRGGRHGELPGSQQAVGKGQVRAAVPPLFGSCYELPTSERQVAVISRCDEFRARNLSTRMRRSVVVISEHVAVCGAC